MRGICSDLVFLNRILMTLRKPTLSCNQSNKAKAILREATITCFTESVESYVGDLQDRVYNSLLYFTGVGDEEGLIVHAHPYTYIQGHYIESVYLDGLRRIREGSLLEGTD